MGGVRGWGPALIGPYQGQAALNWGNRSAQSQVAPPPQQKPVTAIFFMSANDWAPSHFSEAAVSAVTWSPGVAATLFMASRMVSIFAGAAAPAERSGANAP